MWVSTSGSYTSRQLKVHERNYSMYEWMLSAVGFVLKLHRHYCLDRDLRCVVTTRIEYEENKASGISKDCDFGLNYHPGKANVVSDTIIAYVYVDDVRDGIIITVYKFEF